MSVIAAQYELTDDRSLLPAAQRLSIQLDHPVYDCVYVALAVREGVALITADQRLAAKASGMTQIAVVTLSELAHIPI